MKVLIVTNALAYKFMFKRGLQAANIGLRLKVLIVTNALAYYTVL